ncbi:hypothetical protein NDA18_002260 [Ustilago nuda]|nr:hypothetical protein NDA18_002260 [Ustilago nuda]
MAKLSKLRPLSMDDSSVLALNSRDDEDWTNGGIKTASKRELGRPDRPPEHLLLQLARTLGWKSTIQTFLTSTATAEEKEEVLMTLAKIRDLILPPPSSSDSSE